MNLNKAIKKAAKHWYKDAGFSSPEALIRWLKQRRGFVSISPKKGWGKARFSDWGRAQKTTRGLQALKKAIDGNPSPQWLAVWAK